jgi:hypothetical protein
VHIDLEADLNSRDHTGLCWSFLDEAADPTLIQPGAVIIAGDADAAAVAEVVELETIDTGTIVRFRRLPGSLHQYEALVSRLHLSAES